MYFIMLKTAHAGFRGAESGAAPQRQTAFQSFELFMVLIMKTRMIRILCAAAFLALGLGGCSRSQMNFQIAEAIGTAGMYENNEPVETPQMAEKRKAQEESDRAEAELVSVLDRAGKLALGYNYEEALEVLDTITGQQSQDERVLAARSQYEQGGSSLEKWEGKIPHLCFPCLIEDSMMAFDGDNLAYTYNTSMVTTREFKRILQSLYDNHYILIDIHSIAGPVTDDRGTTTVEALNLKVPSGKKPILLSQDNLNYEGVRNGDGIATKLVLDEDGKVKAKYTDSGGHDLVGDYDFIPILDNFIEEHPDFSYQGARGIVSVSGSEGVFGYDLPENSGSDTGSGALTSSRLTAADMTPEQKAVADISAALRAEGWQIASAGWSHGYMNSMSASEFASEMDNWVSRVGVLTGDADILFYPYGAEVSYPGDNLDYLTGYGFIYLCGLWADTDYREVTDEYMRMTRRFIDGYTLQNAPHYFTDFFVTENILDEDR